MNRESTSIIFTGDIGFDRYMDHHWEDEALLSKPILDFFHSADHVAANVEGTIANAPDEGGRGMFFHAMDPAVSRVLQRIGADIWCNGNNHTMDAGRTGIISTQRIATAANARILGAGLNITEASAPVFFDEAGGIGMFCLAYMAECVPATESDPGVFRWDDMERIERRIHEIKERCRWCVVISHGGEEFSSMPLPYTRERYLKYLELGADVIVAHHPHVPENYECFNNGKAIFYSLGNFIFDTDYQRAHPYTDRGVLLKLIFTEKKMDFEAMGIQIVRGPERIVEAPLPEVFTNISETEYVLLSPLAAKAFVEEVKRKMVYLSPDRFKNAPVEVWNNFFAVKPRSYAEGAHMDFQVILPFAEAAAEGAWKHSKLEGVKQYILRQLKYHPS